MRELVIALVVLTVVCTLVLAALPWILRRRGVDMLRTKFGLTLVFDSADADGTPVRLLNVNGTFQSVSYVPEGLRFELACVYHREMAQVIESLVRARGASRGDPLRVMVMGGAATPCPSTSRRTFPRSARTWWRWTPPSRASRASASSWTSASRGQGPRRTGGSVW